MRQNTFDKKKLACKMLIEQIIKFELKGPGPRIVEQVLLSPVIYDKNLQSK